MALNPPGNREIRLGRHYARRDIPPKYVLAAPALADSHFPAAQTPPESLGPPLLSREFSIEL